MKAWVRSRVPAIRPPAAMATKGLRLPESVPEGVPESVPSDEVFANGLAVESAVIRSSLPVD